MSFFAVERPVVIFSLLVFFYESLFDFTSFLGGF